MLNDKKYNSQGEASCRRVNEVYREVVSVKKSSKNGYIYMVIKNK